MDKTTAADGTLFDAIHQQLLNNDAFLNAEIVGMLQKAVNSGVDYDAQIYSGISGNSNNRGSVQISSSAQYGSYYNLFDIRIFDALVNGNKITVDKVGGWTSFDSNHIQLDAPPASNVTPSLPGSARDDLVFLEAWFDATTGAIKYRIRVVDGVDFSTWSADGIGNFAGGTNPVVNAQGGAASPIANCGFAWMGYSSFLGNSTYGKFYGDTGLFVAYNAANNVNTLDGYVYAISLFRVRRRNNAGFNPDTNPLGALDYISQTTQTKHIVARSTGITREKENEPHLPYINLLRHALLHRFQESDQ